ncbi:hypothetical protein [Cryobacterium sp. Sr3]|uniref:hypothetical protein n=1 Tax=Cryobacterium sp. Sr3 TaxID=1259194 RepID=UPI001F53EFD1|nr:hypothetical protein [Cryobacterium sp. Sr3]
MHGTVMIGKNVKDRALMAMPSKLDCCSSKKCAAEPAPLSARSDSEQTDDRRVGRITGQTRTRFSGEYKPDEPSDCILGHDPTF